MKRTDPLSNYVIVRNLFRTARYEYRHNEEARRVYEQQLVPEMIGTPLAERCFADIAVVLNGWPLYSCGLTEKEIDRAYEEAALDGTDSAETTHC